MQLEAGEIVKWLLVGGGFTVILVPAGKWWLGREFTTNADFKNYKSNVAKDTEDLVERIDLRIAEIATFMQTYAGHRELDQQRLTALETKVEVFWKVIEQKAADLLHRDDTPEIDMLLEKIRDVGANGLTLAEINALKVHLGEIENNTKRTSGERAAAIILHASLEARFPTTHGDT